jgi:hypothetical protein
MIRLSVIIFSIILFAFSLQPELRSQTISPMLFGQNAWMPDSIGTKRYWGQLHSKWNDIKSSGATVIRFGGIAPDDDRPTNFQYIQMIDSIRAKGMEPILQVPYFNGKHTAAQAAEIVRYVNVTMKKNVKYWIIGNEPDHVYKHTSSSQVAPYLRSFSFAMKDVDPNIKIIGPETAWYNSGILHGLTNPGGSDDVTGKDSKGRWILDIISFHTYPFNGSQSRADVVNYLSSPGKLRDNLATLNGRISNCNNHHKRIGDNLLQVAITEANICFKNSSSDNLYGNGAMSFIGGQFWAEMLAVSMNQNVSIFNFWSVVEGNNVDLNIGYIDKFSGNRQPSWHHFRLMADHFKGAYAHGTDNQANVKAFGSKSSTQVAVLILNQSSSTNHNYTLRLNTSEVSGSNTLKINIDAGISREHSGTIQNQSSTLLVFDPAGNLMKRCEYKLSGHANNNLPPACTNFPPAATVTASGPLTFCEGSSVTLSTSNIAGYTYQWKRNGINISGATGSSFKTTQSGKYVVEVKNLGGTSTSAVQDVIVNPVTSASVSINASATTICSGNSVTFTATPVNGGSTPVYQWKRNGNNVGTNSATYTTSSASNGDVVTCVMTSNKSCVTGSPATSNSITMKVNAVTTASISIAASANNICQGTSVTFTATPVNGGSSPTYQWRVNGNNVGTNNPSFSISSLNNNDVVSCVMTSNKECIYGSPATSNTITIKVNAVTTASVSIATSANNICQGTSVTFTATPANGGSSPVYQWRLNGVEVGTNSSIYTSSSLSNGDIISCSLTSNKECVSGSPATSNSIVMTVNQPSSVSVAISTEQTETCQGTSTTFTAVPVNGGTAPSFQWKRNGSNVGQNNATYTTTLLSNNDVITCVLTSNQSCVNGSPATSNAIAMDVVQTSTVGISISTKDSIVCHGGSAVYTAMPINEGNLPFYQWKRNGVNVGSSSVTYTAHNFISTDTISCELISNKKCVLGSPAQSNHIVVKPFKPLSKITAGGPSDFCEGDSVVLNANTGTGLSYQWFRNNTVINNSQLSSYKAMQPGLYKVGVTEKGCTSESNQINVLVTAKPSSDIIISGSKDFCNAPLIYMSVEEMIDHTYQWKIDSMNIFSATQYFYEAFESGYYQVVVSNKCGTTLSDGVFLDPCIISHTDNHTNEPIVKFYPNPTSGKLTIEYFNKNSDEPVEIVIYDHIGKLIYQQEPSAVAGKLIKEVQFESDLATGIYFLKVRAGDFFFSTRIILAR